MGVDEVAKILLVRSVDVAMSGQGHLKSQLDVRPSIHGVGRVVLGRRHGELATVGARLERRHVGVAARCPSLRFEHD